MGFIGDIDLRQRNDRLTAMALQVDTGRRCHGRATRVGARKGGPRKAGSGARKESHRSDLNRRPLDYESRALPLSYGGAVIQQRLTALVERSTPWCQWWCQNPPRAAPPTAPPNLATGCSTRYSTASARWRIWP